MLTGGRQSTGTRTCGRRSSSRLVTRKAFMKPGMMAMPKTTRWAMAAPARAENSRSQTPATHSEKAAQARPAHSEMANFQRMLR